MEEANLIKIYSKHLCTYHNVLPVQLIINTVVKHLREVCDARINVSWGPAVPSLTACPPSCVSFYLGQNGPVSAVRLNTSPQLTSFRKSSTHRGHI
jgi:hypothetical protein